MCTTNYEYLFVLYVNSIYLVFFKYNEDSGEGLALTRDPTVLTQWLPDLRLRHGHIISISNDGLNGHKNFYIK